MTARAISVSYPAELPITERRTELLDAIRNNQVVIVAGETGSGKSTQLPKMCVELALHEHGWIGHTQPRRIAVRSIAERVAEELGSEVGALVGFKVRFTDRVSSTTAIKAMTDGVLLAEMQHDRLLSDYSMIIIDEAHERSLNIDFLLGYVKQLLVKRPDLKVIVTSATIDTARFSEHFDGAPIIEVSGRTFPVEIRYRPLDTDDREPLSQAEGIREAIGELLSEGTGDILVFCSGEREIREAAEELGAWKRSDLDIVPLYGRLSAAEQHRVFERKTNDHRRIVLATNVAETSLTVPGIRYVIDAGTARISRYSNRTKVQRLPIEAVSQASADQRAGRCGRLGPGICIRLYSGENYEARPEFTEPEIRRTNLASVLLQMAALGLGDIERFPFVDPPELRSIRDGIVLLEELDAVDPRYEGSKKWLTTTGRRLARLPVDPRFGRMVIDAAESGCLNEVIIITAAMSVQDPRDRPSEKREAAAESHRRFAEPGSDFLAWLNLWDHLETERAARSGNQFRKMCRQEFLNVNRIREWQDIVRQLRRVAKSMRWQLNTSAADADTVHRSLLTGLLSHVGMKDSVGNEFTGGRNARFLIGRNSSLARKPPTWVMVGELVETNRLWAHSAARIQPEWAERAGAHVVKRSYDEPEWDSDRGSAMTVERVTLYGVPIVAGRRVHYRKVAPDVARELFIHHALIEGDWHTHHEFFVQNEGVLEQVRKLGARQRRDLFVEYGVLFDFYDARVGAKVTSGADFDSWWNRVRATDPHLLDLRLDEIFPTDADTHADAEYPDSWIDGDLELPVSYEFDSGAADDGVTVEVPVALLGHLDADAFEWNVPGLRRELVTELVRSLPKPLRKHFVPVPDTVDAILPGIVDARGSLIESVRQALRVHSGLPLPADALSLDRLPADLRPLFAVVADDGSILARGRDLDVLKSELAAEVRVRLADGEHDLSRAGERTWVFGTIPERVQTTAAGRQVTAYPSLVDEGSTVGVQLLADAEEHRQEMWLGTRRLLRLNVGGSARILDSMLDSRATLALSVSPHGSKAAWVNDAADCAFGRLLTEAGGPVRDTDAWNALVESVRANLADVVAAVGEEAVVILERHADLRKMLSGPSPPSHQAARTDVAAQLDRLVYPGHLAAVGADRLADVARYLRAMEVRLEKLPKRVEQDAALMLKCRSLDAIFDAHVERGVSSPAIEDLNWLLEEFRVASFAQQLGVNGRVSEKRLRAALNEL